jgi:hypothetical protein
MTDQVFPDLPQTPPPEPPADASAQEESSEALTPAQEMADMSDSPFCRAIGLIAGGLAVTGVTLNFWNLDVLLPLIGTLCLLVGFRALRRVNGFLRAGFTCACLRVLLLFVELGQNAAVFRETAAADMVSTALAFGSAAVQLVLLFCLWQGLLDMQRDAGITPPAAPAAGALLLWYILLYVAAALFASLPLLLGAYVVWYFYLVVRLKKLSKSMAAQGCAIEPVKERFSNPKLVGSLLTVLAVVIACGFLFFGSYRMDWTPKETGTDAQVIEAHERLLALGYPESELNDLSDEDLLTCLRAERVVIKECTGSAYINYSNKPQTNDAFHLTIVAVQRPFDRLFVACHFRWDDGVRFYGTESLAFEPHHDSNSWFAKEFSGRVLYDGPDGTAYTAPYIDPGTKQASLSNWYINCFKQIYCADASFPNDGTNQRGYVACALSNNIDEFTKFEGLFYYVHQNGRFQYPVKTARDYQDFNVNRPLLYNAPFERVQDYFVLFQNEDGVLNIH